MTPMIRTAIVLCAVVPLLSAHAAAQVTEPPEGFTALFNGKNLDGWWGLGTEHYDKYRKLSPEDFAKRQEASRADIAKHWSAQNGELVNDGHGLYLTTNKNYGDFELLVEYKTVPKADSGIYLRGCPQVQIWDTTNEAEFKNGADKGSGGLWNNNPGSSGKDPLVKADKPFGEWNKFRIVMIGQYVSVWLNDKLVVDKAVMHNYFDRKSPIPKDGPIQLQTHGGEIRWRNVFVREIGAEESNKFLREVAEHGGGFEPVFNGKDFAGLKGPTGNYTVTPEGTLMCQDGKGGTIYTEKQYGDFTATLEFLLPPGGNNGLAIRYPGSGDTAYVGMCELQVLDNEHEKFATLDPRQFHGSAYGQVAARRGFLRPTGQWNFQRVTVKGHQITVELNGFVITDADLSKVTEFMYEPAKFSGRLRTTGHFGFAGHSDPVQFRSVNIKPLN